MAVSTVWPHPWICQIIIATTVAVVSLSLCVLAAANQQCCVADCPNSYSSINSSWNFSFILIYLLPTTSIHDAVRNKNLTIVFHLLTSPHQAPRALCFYQESSINSRHNHIKNVRGEQYNCYYQQQWLEKVLLMVLCAVPLSLYSSQQEQQQYDILMSTTKVCACLLL